MAALRDPKREKFAQCAARLLGEGMDRGAAGVQAGIEAGYPSPQSRSFAPNCRKRMNRADVKGRIAELMAPAIEKAEAEIKATVEWAIGKLKMIADVGGLEPRVSDQIAAIALIAKIAQWPEAPQRRELSGPDGQAIATADVSDIERAKALANFIARTRAMATAKAA